MRGFLTLLAETLVFVSLLATLYGSMLLLKAVVS